MRSPWKWLPAALCLCLSAGCTEESERILQAEREARVQAQRREAAAQQQAAAQQEAKERWQLSATGLATLAVLLLLVGVGVGSRTRHADPGA
jgi:hypothetical protein